MASQGERRDNRHGRHLDRGRSGAFMLSGPQYLTGYPVEEAPFLLELVRSIPTLGIGAIGAALCNLAHCIAVDFGPKSVIRRLALTPRWHGPSMESAISRGAQRREVLS